MRLKLYFSSIQIRWDTELSNGLIRNEATYKKRKPKIVGLYKSKADEQEYLIYKYTLRQKSNFENMWLNFNHYRLAYAILNGLINERAYNSLSSKKERRSALFLYRNLINDGQLCLHQQF